MVGNHLLVLDQLIITEPPLFSLRIVGKKGPLKFYAQNYMAPIVSIGTHPTIYKAIAAASG